MNRLSTLRPAVLATWTALFAAVPAFADEVRLTDGRVLYGTVRDRGDAVIVETRSGDVRVDRADVVRIRSDSDLEQELATLATRYGDSDHARIELARIARRYRLEDTMWEHLEAAIGDAAKGRSERLDGFLAELEPELLPDRILSAPVRVRVRDLVHGARPDRGPARIAATEAVLATLPGDEVPAMLRELARTASRTTQRQVALGALRRRAGADGDPFVWRTALVDRDADLGATALAWTRSDDLGARATADLAQGLDHASPALRIRSANVLAELGHPDAVAAIAAAGPRALAGQLAGGSTRGHVAFLNQQAYVRDFDVEVASAAFIADPVVDALQSGVVLDATVASVITVRTRVLSSYRGALRRLTGRDPGEDVAAWPAFAAEWAADRAAHRPATPRATPRR